MTEAVNPVKAEIHNLKTRIDALEAPENAQTGGVHNAQINCKVETIEAEIAKIKVSGTGVNHGGNTLVVGGLDQDSLEAANTWIRGVLSRAGAPAPVEVSKK